MPAEKERNYRWHKFIFLGAVNFCIAVFIGAKGSTFLVAGRSYGEMGSSKANGIIYAFSELEASKWSYVVIATFTFLSWLYFNIGIMNYKKRKKGKPKK